MHFRRSHTDTQTTRSNTCILLIHHIREMGSHCAIKTLQWTRFKYFILKLMKRSLSLSFALTVARSLARWYEQFAWWQKRYWLRSNNPVIRKSTKIRLIHEKSRRYMGYNVLDCWRIFHSLRFRYDIRIASYRSTARTLQQQQKP